MNTQKLMAAYLSHRFTDNASCFLEKNNFFMTFIFVFLTFFERHSNLVYLFRRLLFANVINIVTVFVPAVGS